MNRPHGIATRFRYESQQLLECIRFSRHLSGGPEHLVTALRHSFALALPSALAGSFLQAADVTMPSLPSSSLMRHYEMRLDIALIFLQRDRGHRDVVRYMWSGSSPVAGHGWLWVQHHEISRAKLLETCEAAWQLERALGSHHEGVRYRWAAQGDDAPLPSEAFHAKEEWSGWLSALRANIVEHVHPPVAPGVGQRDLLGKAKAIVHMGFADQAQRELIQGC